MRSFTNPSQSTAFFQTGGSTRRDCISFSEATRSSRLAATLPMGEGVTRARREIIQDEKRVGADGGWYSGEKRALICLIASEKNLSASVRASRGLIASSVITRGVRNFFGIGTDSRKFLYPLCRKVADLEPSFEQVLRYTFWLNNLSRIILYMRQTLHRFSRFSSNIHQCLGIVSAYLVLNSRWQCMHSAFVSSFSWKCSQTELLHYFLLPQLYSHYHATFFFKDF